MTAAFVENKPANGASKSVIQFMVAHTVKKLRDFSVTSFEGIEYPLLSSQGQNNIVAHLVSHLSNIP